MNIILQRHASSVAIKFGAGDALRNASTFDIDVHVRQCALKLQDERIQEDYMHLTSFSVLHQVHSYLK